MSTIANEITAYNETLVAVNNSINTYKILSDFKGTYIEKQMLKEESIVDSIFRVFIPFKPERQRNINVCPENNFDPYIDSLMDYPTIIGHMMGKPWQMYNRLISVQVPYCINECWHCYLPTDLFKQKTLKERTTVLTARDIIDKFYLQKKMDALAGKETNVLRITGGEPFQLPTLILECLELLEQDKNSDFANVDVLKEIVEKGETEDYKHIFLWTETNLTPFISLKGKPAFMDKQENKEILTKLSKYDNLVVHPCFHGLDEMEYKNITHCKKEISQENLVDALKKLLQINTDTVFKVYPTFGSNVSNPNNLYDFFTKLHNVEASLPLRTALVEYKTDYEPILDRLKEDRKIDLYSRFANLRIWNLLLQKTYGVGYGTIPRHLTISNDKSLLPMTSPPNFNEIIYLFKGSFRDLYHREILDIMSYPMGYVYDVEYEEKWIQSDFFNHIKHRPEYFKSREGVFVYADKKDGNLYPLRVFKLLGASVAGSVLKLNLELQDFITFSPEDDNKNLGNSLQLLFNKYFGKKTVPPSPVGNYVLYGEAFFNKEVLSFKELITNKMSIKQVADFDGFRKNTDSLVKSNFMHDSLHYHIKINNSKVKIDENNIAYYEVKAGNNFTITIENYLPNYPYFESLNSSERNINISVSKECVELMGNDTFNCSKYRTKDLVFKTKIIDQKEEVIIKFHSEQREFKCANVEIRLHIVPLTIQATLVSSGLSILFLCFMGLGSILANYNYSVDGNFAPLKLLKENLSPIKEGENYSYLWWFLGWIGLLGVMTFSIVKTRLLNTTLFRKMKLS